MSRRYTRRTISAKPLSILLSTGPVAFREYTGFGLETRECLAAPCLASHGNCVNEIPSGAEESDLQSAWNLFRK